MQIMQRTGTETTDMDSHWRLFVNIPPLSLSKEQGWTFDHAKCCLTLILQKIDFNCEEMGSWSISSLWNKPALPLQVLCSWLILDATKQQSIVASV